MRHDAGGTVVIAAAPARSPVGKSGREGYQRPRAHKLTIEERDAVRLDAKNGHSLRSLARAFGVSHETIRAVLRHRGDNMRVDAPVTVTEKCSPRASLGRFKA
jgi:hypothetical protein